jgi:hypothetical protein
MQLNGVFTVGIWSDLDCLEIREALKLFGSGDAPVRYVDGSGIPVRYKLRRVAGDPVPMNVLAEMERHPAEPWKVRDRMLREMKWHAKPIPWPAESDRQKTAASAKPIDPSTGIWPISEWGTQCGRGLPRNR